MLALCLWLAHRAGSESRPLSSASTRALLSVRGAFGEDLFERIELERIALRGSGREDRGREDLEEACRHNRTSYEVEYVKVSIQSCRGLMLDLARAYMVDQFVRQAYHE